VTFKSTMWMQVFLSTSQKGSRIRNWSSSDDALSESDLVDIDDEQHWIRYLALVPVEGIARALQSD
jgi:hypothetical protein